MPVSPSYHPTFTLRLWQHPWRSKIYIYNRGNVIIKTHFSSALDLEITDYVCFDILHVRGPVQSLHMMGLKANQTTIT